jgi:CRISPR-associated protein Cas5t
MEFYKIEINSFTSSFRYPNLISGFQPTLDVPPLSTILGLINAAAGKYLVHEKLEIGYYFQYEAKAVDLETIYQVESNKQGKPTNNAKSNIINREFLFNNKLLIYLNNEEIVGYFRQPVYPLLLGRSNDLASVVSISRILLLENDKADKIKGQIVPFKGLNLPGQIQALPKYFSDTIPRRNLGVEPYSVINYNVPDYETQIKAYRDRAIGKNGIDVFIHKIEF